MARQDQSVEGGTAYQAQGNLTVTNGMDADQMAAVMIAMAKQLQVHFAEAEIKLEERLFDFRKTVLEEFAKPQNTERTEAFKDPDFQFVLNDAQKVFARDGSPDLRDDLVKLLVQRAQHDSKERIAKILNHSIELAGTFSKNEYAALAMNFLFLTVKIDAYDINAVFDQYNSFISAFYKDLSEAATVYEYIEAQRCGTINYVVTRDLIDLLYQQYSILLSDGFTEGDITSIYPHHDLSFYSGLIGLTGNAKKPYRFVKAGPIELSAELQQRGMPQPQAQAATRLYHGSNIDKNKFQEIFLENIGGFDRVLHVWKNTALSQMTLTAVGKTIAHSALTSRSPMFNADLSIWVQ